MALDEGDGLVCRSAGAPDFRDRMRRATGRTLHVPTLAERLRWHGETSISCANVSPGAAYFQDPDGHGWVYHAGRQLRPGPPPVDDPGERRAEKGHRRRPRDDRAVLRRNPRGARARRWRSCGFRSRTIPAIIRRSARPSTAPRSPRADANVRQVFETVRRLDPSGENILFVTGSDHGMETVAEAIDLTELLVAAGLKEGPDSRDVVVAPNGTAATLYFAEPEGDCRRGSRNSSPARTWVGEVFAGDGLPRSGCRPTTRCGSPSRSPARTGSTRMGCGGYSPIVQDPADNESKIGFGQHGGLGPNEQRPFLMIEGGGFAPGERREPSSLIDIAPTVLRHLHMDHDDMDGARVAAGSLTIRICRSGPGAAESPESMNTGLWNMGSGPCPWGDPGMTGINGAVCGRRLRSSRAGLRGSRAPN